MEQMHQRWLMNPGEAAAALGISRATLFRLIASGTLPSVKVGGSRRVGVKTLKRWLDAREEPRGVKGKMSAKAKII